MDDPALVENLFGDQTQTSDLSVVPLSLCQHRILGRTKVLTMTKVVAVDSKCSIHRSYLFWQTICVPSYVEMLQENASDAIPVLALRSTSLMTYTYT